VLNNTDAGVKHSIYLFWKKAISESLIKWCIGNQKEKMYQVSDLNCNLQPQTSFSLQCFWQEL